MIAVACIQSLVRSGIDVLALVRPNTRRLNRLPDTTRLTVAECDMDGLENFPVAGASYDTFFHFAWTGTSRTERNDPVGQSLNIGYALQAVALAQRMGCKRFIGAGSQAEYGPSRDILSPDSPVFPEIAYGMAKYAAGKLCGLRCQQIGMEFNWARIFSVYGPYDNTFAFMDTLLSRLLAGERMPLTNGEQRWDYLYSEDAGEALRLIGEKGHDQAIYCIGSGTEHPMLEYFRIIGKTLGIDLSTQIGQIPNNSQPDIRLCADIRTLSTDTGFIPRVSFEEGIRRTINWKRGDRS